MRWLVHLAKTGHPQKKGELLDSARKIVEDDQRKTPFNNNRPGETWYRSFMHRHPEIVVREPEGVTAVRATVTEESIRKWFEKTKDYLSNNEGSAFADIMADPRRVLNTDETSFSLCPKSGKVLGPRGWRNVYDLKRGNEKDTLTVLATFSADGKVLPGMIVYPYQRPPREVVASVPQPWAIGLSDSGWMKSDTFFEYIVNVLDPYLVQQNIPKPVVLFLDGHKSHMSYTLSEECSKRHIIIYTLLPNSTHILQPADVSVFKPLKSTWKLTVREFQREHPNTVVTRVNFAALIDKTIGVAAKESTVRNGFRACGLFPWNPDVVDYSKCMVDVLAPISTHTPAGMTVTLDQEIIDLDNTLSHGELSSAEKADLFPRFWELINVAITNATKNASQVPRVRAEEEDNGRRDERENGGQEPGERRVTREEENGRRDERENGGQEPEERRVTREEENGRRDEREDGGQEPEERRVTREEENGRRDERENGGQEPEERRVTREEENGRRDERENGGQEPEERRVTREEENGRRDERENGGQEPEERRVTREEENRRRDERENGGQEPEERRVTREEENGRRDEREDGGQEPEERRVTREEENGRRDERENGGQEPEERRVTREEENGRRDEREDGGQEPEERRVTREEENG